MKIRPYRETDAEATGRLIADTYTSFNLDFVPEDELGDYLGPFQFARSAKEEHRSQIAALIEAKLVFVAENVGGEIVGVLRGSPGRLHSLFVRGDHHKQGIGRKLMETFEKECIRSGCEKITLASTLYAVPFYQNMGYKKSTGIRRGWSFQGENMHWQPMKKVLGK